MKTNQNIHSKNSVSLSKLPGIIQEQITKPNIHIPDIFLPKGGGAIKNIDEKFEVNASSGTVSFHIPFPIPSSRANFQPSLALTYNSDGDSIIFDLVTH